VSDQPAFETEPPDLGVELASQRVTPEAERLVRADLGRSEKLGASWQVEGVAMGDIIFDKPNASLTRRLRVVAVLQPFDP
jgi:hypothetical protein